jgi:parvulin-like peptidyl-prolyl isomerase
LAKKQKKATPERVPTKRQLSKWQRQERIRRIVIIAAVVLLVGIGIVVGRGWIEDYKSDPLREVVIEVNGVPFTMEYYVNTLDIYVGNYISTTVNTYLDFYMQAYNYTREETIQLIISNAISDLRQNTDNIADMITGQAADDIINAELLREGAKNLDIEVTSEEIDAKLAELEWPDERVYQDIIRVSLLQEKLGEYLGSQLPDTMEQAHVQAMLVESQEVADEVITKVEAGGNFTALAEEFSCNSTIEGDLGWLPEELMPNTLIANAAFNLTPGQTIHRIYDKTAIKDIGYWLIEVTAQEADEIEARAMLLGSEAEAEQVKAELDSANFSSLAEQYSQHESKDEGGELGWLKPGDMGSEAFDQVAFNITANEVSQPVKDESVPTTGGYWLVKVVDRGNHELEDEVREQLIGKHFNDWLEEWSEESTIETHLDVDKKEWAINKVLEGTPQ